VHFVETSVRLSACTVRVCVCVCVCLCMRLTLRRSRSTFWREGSMARTRQPREAGGSTARPTCVRARVRGREGAVRCASVSCEGEGARVRVRG
jgi:hypothetical protein